ncbi:MAG: tRNA uridine-5-carboxymethylaminomethyl(34) synthesis GTPase MnmE [Xanthomonadaceae bacterium]|jgi:tRNA modification GTPase|nr:tRNA uridine-5-carboxymethylaminomethyl(34) synthesis GTPase MnmE [Xanthomonadaceae bacterium]
MTGLPTDTIAAISTPGGTGGVGIVRISGPAAQRIAEQLCGRMLEPRHAGYMRFHDAQGTLMDDGIALFFPGPRSFTGEDVVELQGHGSPVLLQQLVSACCALGARPARPGEFSERAFLNGKLDLAQTEAIADLIAASDARAARAARRSLEGVFSKHVDDIAQNLLQLRVHVEAAIDFVDEPIDTLGGEAIRNGLDEASEKLRRLQRDAERGRKLRDGLHTVLVGPPNAGKSSLLNALAGYNRAIVTDIAGTTRDVLHEVVRLDGLELTLVDTAGLRDGGDSIEREGMRRARGELERADLVLAVVDASALDEGRAAVEADLPDGVPVLWIYNKADLLNAPPPDWDGIVHVSALTGLGMDRLHAHLRQQAESGSPADSSDGEFTARARHVEALIRARAHVENATEELRCEHLELAAEELRLAHDALGEITGRISADEMLGHIFSTFCIGK